MTVEIFCIACGRLLTGQCQWGGKDDYDSECVDQLPAVPKGYLIRLSAEDAADVVQGDRIVGRRIYSEAGAIAGNPGDIVAGGLHSAGDDNGCCGSSGADGPNRACLCGAIVATEWSDCWTQAEVRFLPHAVGAAEKT